MAKSRIEDKRDPEKESNVSAQAASINNIPIIKFFTDERLRLFLGITMLLCCAFILIAFISHLKNGPADQSIVYDQQTHVTSPASTSTQSLAEGASPQASNVDDEGEKAKNAAGPIGAWLSQVFLCDSLGLGSLVFLVYAWYLALGLLGFKKVNFWSLTFKCLLLAITISISLGLFLFNSSSALKWGGLHGHFINQALIDSISAIGAFFVTCILITAVICVYLNELRHAWNSWRQRIKNNKLRKQLEEDRKSKASNIDDPTSPMAETPDDANGSESNSGNHEAIEMDLPVAEQYTEAQPQKSDDFTQDKDAAQQRKDALDDIFAEQDYDDNSQASPTASNAETTEPKSKVGDDSPVVQPVDESPTSNEDEKPSAPHMGHNREQIADGFSIDDPVGDKDNDYDIDDQTPLPPVHNRSNQPGNEFSVIAPEIEVAPGFDGDSSDSKKPQSDILSQFGPYDHRADLSHYRFPSVDLLNEVKASAVVDMNEQQANKDRIIKTLLDYKIPISRIEATVGPTVTLYEIVPAEGVRISQIKRLEDDIALSLSALGIRIIAPIPGKGTVGIEVPNSDPQTVSMRSVITSKKYQECKMALPMAMGATISNDIFIADLAKMPHLLVAGATGMGKSVGLNAIIASLLYKKHPSELKFVLIDPKMVEFSLYSKLERHYMAKLPSEDDAIITDPAKVIATLNSLCVEMDDRYALLRKANVRSLEEYNQKFTERKLNPNDGHKYLPYIVVIVDEFADLIMTAGKEVETPIARIAQKARAVGMHMIIATQRPSTNVITGIIKANFPGRIAFRVSQMVDSKTILDRTGANQLIGRGDMLFSHNGSMDRVQCAFISTAEVEAITQSIDDQVGYEHAYYLPEVPSDSGDIGSAGATTDRDPLFDEAARYTVSRQVGSTSMLQRQFNIGYNRAGRLMDQMEAAGIVGPVNGSKPRSILVDSMTLENILQR